MAPLSVDTEKPVAGDILIMDDTPANLRLLAGVLTQQGYRVRMAPNGKLALMNAQATSPDLILLDILMPQMGGYQVCQLLKADERTREVPVIFLSALSETLDRVKAFSTVGVDYITKPFQVEEVLARVKTHLTIRNLQKELQGKNAQLEEKNQQLQEKNAQLQEALDNVKTLKGFFPIFTLC